MQTLQQKDIKVCQKHFGRLAIYIENPCDYWEISQSYYVFDQKASQTTIYQNEFIYYG